MENTSKKYDTYVILNPYERKYKFVTITKMKDGNIFDNTICRKTYLETGLEINKGIGLRILPLNSSFLTFLKISGTI